MKKTVLCIALIFLFAKSAPAFDLGINAENHFKAYDGFFYNKALVSAWFKYFLKNDNYFFSSLDVINENSNSLWNINAAPGRTGFYFNLSDIFFLEAGRINYHDVTGMIAEGLFDGIHSKFMMRNFSVALGAFYSGLLQKNQTKIIMSSADAALYEDKNNWFAPRKMIASLEWQMRDFMEYRNSICAGVLSQLDFSGAVPLNNNYFNVKGSLGLTGNSELKVTSILGVTEYGGSNFQSASSIDLDLKSGWDAVKSRLSFGFLWSSGPGDKGFSSFLPVTYAEQGSVFDVILSNLMLFKIIFGIEFVNFIFIEADARSFFRTSSVVPVLNIEDESLESLLGNELYMSFRWKPALDISLNAGFGVFFPNKSFYDGYFKPVLWKFKAGVRISS